MEVLRTPDERFEGLLGWSYEPEYYNSERAARLLRLFRRP